MHNSGVTQIGNGVNNLTSMPQPDGITLDILQQPHIAPNLTSGMQHPCSSSRIINQNQVFGTSSRTSKYAATWNAAIRSKFDFYYVAIRSKPIFCSWNYKPRPSSVYCLGRITTERLDQDFL
ncbi:hypothetical protein K1719_028169 [Acacia pycnantha]|nr:hypothetical protein K1719_028169 [Acacia pycnantha]